MEKEIRARFDKTDKSVGRLEARMDKKFSAVDKRFNSVDKRFEAVDKRFDRLEQKLDQVIDITLDTRRRVAALEERVTQLEEATSRMMNSIDALMKVATDIKVEYAALRLQNERYDRWIHEIAEKVGVKLTY